MPSGARHTLASGVVAASSGAALFLYSPEAAFWCTAGALGGVLLTPDHDLPGNITYHYVRRYAGLPAGFLWQAVWFIYSRLFKHRSFWSHGPIVSTAIRLLYLSLFIAPFWMWLELPAPTFTVSAGWWLLGLVLSDSCHAVLDRLDELLGGRL